MNTIISFSGGRTSGMMLHHILRQHGFRLPEHVKVCFANTGKEHPATLDFVRDCGENWGVEIVWLQWQPAAAATAAYMSCYGLARQIGFKLQSHEYWQHYPYGGDLDTVCAYRERHAV